jgi:hypothetical protein
MSRKHKDSGDWVMSPGRSHSHLNAGSRCRYRRAVGRLTGLLNAQLSLAERLAWSAPADRGVGTERETAQRAERSEVLVARTPYLLEGQERIPMEYLDLGDLDGPESPVEVAEYGYMDEVGLGRQYCSGNHCRWWRRLSTATSGPVIDHDQAYTAVTSYLMAESRESSSCGCWTGRG